MSAQQQRVVPKQSNLNVTFAEELKVLLHTCTKI